jgi:hypothetical protein
MSASLIRWLILLLFLAAPLVGISLLFISPRLPGKATRIAIRIVGLLCLAGFLALLALIAPYPWAAYLETKWQPAHPKTRTELESFLSLYSQHPIQPSQSDWGHDYRLQPGERMIQYLLLWNAPLDVVYTTNDTIVVIYTSYE